MTSNSTEPPFTPPVVGISESERDKYLLIATFLSVLIIFGILVAIMHKKCRETLSRSRSWIISKTVRHRPNSSRTSGRSTVVEMSFRDPSSPVFSKEVNPPVMFYLGSSNDSQTSKPKRNRRQRSSGTDHEDDSGISVISGGPNIPMCSLTNKCFKVDRDVNDNLTLTYNPSSISLDPDVSLVKVLAPEVPGTPTKTGDKTKEPQHPKLRRSSTVIDKMNFLNGYVPSSRDEDYTVITLTDESESELHSPNMLNQFKYDDRVNFVNKSPKKLYQHYEGIDNPAFYLKNKMLSKSLTELGQFSDDTISQGSQAHICLDRNVLHDGSNQKLITHHAEVHKPQKANRSKNQYEKRNRTVKGNRPVRYRTYTATKSIDKESQELYKRILREKIQDILFSDSQSASSVKSDQTFVKTAKLKHRN